MIRDGRREDASFLAWVILMAARSHLSRGWFDIALNKSEEECLAFLNQLTITPTLSLWHYSRFLVGEVGGRAVAALGTYRAGDAYDISPLAMTEAAQALGMSLREQAEFWERGGYAFTCTHPYTNDDCLVLESTATLPEYQGRGYAVALFEEAFERGRARGLKEVQINYLIGNPAERMYERFGFRVTDEWRHPEFEAAAGSPGIRRAVKNL